MTANTQIPNEAGGAPVWQPTPPAAEPEPAGAGELPSEEIRTSGGTVEFAPGYADKPRARAKNRRAGSTTALLMVGALVAVGGVGFALGHNLSAGSGGGNSAADGQNGFRANGSFNPGQFGPNASGAPERGFGGGGSVTGTVESVTADSMTIKLASGQTVTLAIGSSTTYHSQTSADSSQVTAGSTVIVQTSGGSGTGAPGASASAGAGSSAGTGSTTTNRTATDVTVTSK